jgi:hypothetical protein
MKLRARPPKPSLRLSHVRLAGHPRRREWTALRDWSHGTLVGRPRPREWTALRDCPLTSRQESRATLELTKTVSSTSQAWQAK